MQVWIDQDCCTGAGLCVDRCPDLFVVLEGGLGYVPLRQTSDDADIYDAETIVGASVAGANDVVLAIRDGRQDAGSRIDVR